MLAQFGRTREGRPSTRQGPLFEALFDWQVAGLNGKTDAAATDLERYQNTVTPRADIRAYNQEADGSGQKHVVGARGSDRRGQGWFRRRLRRLCGIAQTAGRRAALPRRHQYLLVLEPDLDSY